MLNEAPDSPRRWCFGCGQDNAEGLRIDFRLEDGQAVGYFDSRQAHQGYPGVMHGGIAATALDEAMAWAAIASGAWATTARMEVKFRRPLPLDETLKVTARVAKDRGRWLEVSAQLSSTADELLAEGSGLLQKLPEEEARRLDGLYFREAKD
ncbi:MAG TPA: PaaI family thioesterase [Dehalococcoidia bacterium]|nr:PaaI family thioesterase [Dehalococcoidia bacterium]